MNNKLLDMIPQSILEKGFKMPFGTFGYAFYATEILELSKILKNEGISVLGGDVMVLNVDKELEYSPTCESWYLNYGKDKEYKAYVTESIDEMERYVRMLNDKCPDFLYSPTFADRADFERIKTQIQ